MYFQKQCTAIQWWNGILVHFVEFHYHRCLILIGRFPTDAGPTPPRRTGQSDAYCMRPWTLTPACLGRPSHGSLPTIRLLHQFHLYLYMNEPRQIYWSLTICNNKWFKSNELCVFYAWVLERFYNHIFFILVLNF